MAGRRAPGTGSIIEREDQAGRVIYYGKWTPPGGRQVKRRIGLKRVLGSREGLTRVQAEAKLRELMGSVHVDAPVSRRVTIREAGAEYVAVMERKGRKPSSVRSVRGTLGAWLGPHFDGRALDAIGSEDVDDLIRKMEKAGLAAKTIRNHVGTLAAIFNFARHGRRRWATTNPVDEVDLPAIPSYGEIRFLTREQVRALIAHAQPGEYRAIDAALYLAAPTTGLRLGELLALRWRDVDTPSGRLRVRRAWDSKNHVYTTPKSKRSERAVPMTDELAGVLERLGKARYGDTFDPQDVADELVFADPYAPAEPMCHNRLRERYGDALKAAGVEPRRFHDLRHTFGTQMAAAGVPMRTLQELMGHQDIKTTMRYADYAPNERERAWVEAAFGRGTSRGTSLSESQVTSDDLTQASIG